MDSVEMAAENIGGRFAFDTTLILFFLALDLGQSLGDGIDTVLSLITLTAVLVLPYFLPFGDTRPGFGRWVSGRAAIAGLAAVVGMGFRSVQGVVLPEEARFLPLTLLIAAGMFTCYFHFYGILKFRLAK